MIRLSAALVLIASSSMAGTLCDDLNALHSDTLDLEQGTASCRQSLAMDGARHMHCVLEFPYRSQDATDAFEVLHGDLAACLGPTAIQISDQSVNHPDAYDLREFELDGRGYAVSIKDKGALQQTLVFVRVQML